MPNAQESGGSRRDRLEILRRLRTSQGVTQAEAARALGLGAGGRDLLRVWEYGERIPELKYQEPFIIYLAHILNLQQNRKCFDEVWTILVKEWDWTPVTELEWSRVVVDADLYQLRTPVGDFIGRQGQIDLLVEKLTSAVKDKVAAVACLYGMPGSGKTQLAYVVAQRLKHRFPDAHIVVPLGGLSRRALSPVQALQTILRAFGRHQKLSNDLADLERQYHQTLEQKQVLIVADDAGDLKLLQHLIPPPGSILLVTSRQRLKLPRIGMIAVDVQPFTAADSETFLQGLCPRIGTLAPKLAEMCGHLPLALRIAGTYLFNYDTVSIADYLTALSFERLRYLRDNDDPNNPQVSVEASISLSYNALELRVQQALCRLSVFPSDWNASAAQAILGEAADEAVNTLRRFSLVAYDSVRERFYLHDLIRLFSKGRIQDSSHVQELHARHYAGVAEHLHRLYHQGGDALLQSLKEFDLEHLNFEAALAWCLASPASPSILDMLMWYHDALVSFVPIRYDLSTEWLPRLENMLLIAHQMKDHNAEGVLLGSLGNAYIKLSEPKKGIELLEQSLVLARTAHNREEECVTLQNLGDAYQNLHDFRMAQHYYTEALKLARELKQSRWVEDSLGNLGHVYYLRGRAFRAFRYYLHAYMIAESIEDLPGQATALRALGMAYWRLGRGSRAIRCYQQAVAINRELGDAFSEAQNLTSLGLACMQLGKKQAGLSYLRESEALCISRKIPLPPEIAAGLSLQKYPGWLLAISRFALIFILPIYRRLRVERREEFLLATDTSWTRDASANEKNRPEA